MSAFAVAIKGKADTRTPTTGNGARRISQPANYGGIPQPYPTPTQNSTARAMGTTEGIQMKTVKEYLERAAECRQTARSVVPEHREELEEMARAWEQLAESRRRAIAKYERESK